MRRSRCAFNAFRPSVLAALIAFCCAAPALADEVADVKALYQARRFTEALGRADAAIKQTPGDARMRFVKGLILSDMGRRAEAIAVFQRLTADFPAMPEPYNNLAVLHASNGDYDSARDALEGAIKANPEYAQAYENLGDVYVTLASQRYARLLRQNPDNTQVRLKYLMVRSALENAGERLPTAKPAPLATEGAAATAVANPAPAPVTPASPPAAGAPAPAVGAAVAAVPSKQEQPASAKKTAAASDDVIKGAVLAAVEQWAKAWSAQDLPAYLASYAAEFRPPHRMTRPDWEAQRRARIVKPEPIRVSIASPRITLDGDTATVRFTQHYVSGKLDSTERKTLELQKSGDQWRIVREHSGA